MVKVLFGICVVAAALILTVALCIGKVELVVLHHCCAARPDIINYVNEVIAEAIDDRHNCRVSILPIIYVFTLK